jgi:hypothetical protein
MVMMEMLEWTPERDRLVLFLQLPGSSSPGPPSQRLGGDVDELQRRLAILLEPSCQELQGLAVTAGHAAAWGAITSGTVLEGTAFVPANALTPTAVGTTPPPVRRISTRDERASG